MCVRNWKADLWTQAVGHHCMDGEELLYTLRSDRLPVSGLREIVPNVVGFLAAAFLPTTPRTPKELGFGAFMPFGVRRWHPVRYIGLAYRWPKNSTKAPAAHRDACAVCGVWGGGFFQCC